MFFQLYVFLSIKYYNIINNYFKIDKGVRVCEFVCLFKYKYRFNLYCRVDFYRLSHNMGEGGEQRS